MKLSSYFTKHSLSDRSQFWESKDHRTLVMGCYHSVTGRVGGRLRTGEAKVNYKLQFNKHNSSFSTGLELSGVEHVGVQSTDAVNAAIAKLKPRTSYSFSEVLRTHFDMRALLYVLGAATTIGIGGGEFEVPTAPASYRTLGVGYAVPDLGDIIVGPNMLPTRDEFATFLALAGEAGVRSVTILADDIPGTGGNFKVRRGLASFAQRMAANILLEATNCVCYGAHKLAFERGKTVGVSLHGHTDEGGWMRKLMKTCRYPPSVGIIFGMGTDFDTIPLQEPIALEHIAPVVIGDYLEFVALFPVADFRVNGCQTVLSARKGAENRPSKFDRLGGMIADIFTEVRELLCDKAGVLHDRAYDAGASSEYITCDRLDDHFAVETMVPWWWVEPAPLLTETYDGYFVPAKHGDTTTLPLFKASDVEYATSSLDGDGRLSRGDTMWVVRNKTTLREEGASYLLSSHYDIKDGYGLARNVPESPNGQTGSAMLLHDPARNSIAEARWYTPDNPLPIPREGESFGTTVLEFTSAGPTTTPTPREAMSGVVESRFSLLMPVEMPVKEDFISHRDVPPRFRRFVKLTPHRYDTLVSLRVVSLGGTTAPEPSPPLPAPEQTGTSGSGVTQNPDPHDEINDVGEHLNVEDSTLVPQTEDDGIPTKLTQAPAGVKPTLPVKKAGTIKPSEESDGDEK